MTNDELMMCLCLNANVSSESAMKPQDLLPLVLLSQALEDHLENLRALLRAHDRRHLLSEMTFGLLGRSSVLLVLRL